MSLIDMLRAGAQKFGRTEEKENSANNLYTQMVNNPEVYNSVYNAMSEELATGKSSGGKAFNWSISMNHNLIGLEDEDIKKDPVKAMTLGAIYKMAEVSSDAYRSYKEKGFDQESSSRLADLAIFGVPNVPGLASLYEGITTPGRVGETLSYLTSVDREGELATSYMFADVDGSISRKLFASVSDYTEDGKRLDVGSPFGAFTQLAMDKTTLGNALIKAYDYFKGNSPSFFTDYRSAALYENLYGDKTQAMVSPVAQKAATFLGYGGAIAENFAAASVAGSMGMLGLNVVKGRLMDYEHATGMDQRFNLNKFLNGALFDVATSGVGIAFSQALSSGAMGMTPMGRDGINILRRFVRSHDPKLLSSLIAAPIINMGMNTSVDMGIDYSFHNLGRKVFGEDTFSQVQNTRFDLGKDAAKKIVNEFMFRSAMVVGSGMARSALAARTSGEAPMLSGKWFDETFTEMDKKTLGYTFKTRAAALMWNIYPSNVKAVDQIMKDQKTRISLEQALKETSRGQFKGFSQAYNYFWHMAERQSNALYRWFAPYGSGTINVDRLHSFVAGMPTGLEMLTSPVDGSRINITTMEQGELVGDKIYQALVSKFTEILPQAELDNVLNTTSQTGMMPEQIKSGMANAISHVYRLFNNASVEASDAEKAEIFGLIRGGISRAINETIHPIRSGDLASTEASKLTAASKIVAELEEYTKVRALGEYEEGTTGMNIAAKITNIKPGDFGNVAGSGEEFFGKLINSIASESKLDDIFVMSKADLDKVSENLTNYMKLVEEAGELGAQTGYLERVSEGGRTYYRPTTIQDDQGRPIDQDGPRERQQLFPFMSALASTEESGLAGSVVPVLSRLAEVAGRIKKDTDSKKSLSPEKRAAFFTTQAEYLDLMGKASGEFLLSEIDSAVNVINDKGASNSQKVLAFLKAKESVDIIGSSFYKYSNQADQQKFIERRAELNRVAKTLDVSTAKIGGVNQSDLFIDSTLHEMTVYIKSAINPLITMDINNMKAYNLDATMNRDGRRNIDDFRGMYNLLDSTMASLPVTKALGRLVKVLDAKGEAYSPRWDDLMNPLDKFDSYDKGNVLSDSIDSILGFYVLKKINIEMTRQKMSLAREGKYDEASAITHKTFIESDSAKPVLDELSRQNVLVRWDDADNMVVVQAKGDGGFGYAFEGTVGAKSKHDLYSYLLDGLISPSELNIDRQYYFDANAPKLSSTQQYFVSLGGKVEPMGVEQALNYLKGEISGLPEMVQTMTYLRSNPVGEPVTMLSDQEVGVIMRRIMEKAPGFALIGSDDRNLSGQMTAARTLLNRLMMESNIGVSAEVYSIRNTLNTELGVESSVSRIGGLGVKDGLLAYNLKTRFTDVEKWDSIRNRMEELGFVFVGNNDSTQSSYIFVKKPSTRAEVTATASRYVRRTTENYRRFRLDTDKSSENLVKEDADLQKENLIRVISATSEEDVSNYRAGWLKSLNEFVKRRTMAPNEADNHLTEVGRLVEEARKEYRSLMSESSPMDAGDSLKSFAKFIDTVQKASIEISKAIGGKEAGESPGKWEAIPEIIPNLFNAPDFDGFRKIKARLFPLAGETQLPEDAASADALIKFLDGSIQPNTQERNAFDELVSESKKYAGLSPEEKAKLLESKSMQLTLIETSLTNKMMRLSGEAIEPVSTMIKRYNSSSGADEDIALLKQEIGESIKKLEAKTSEFSLLMSGEPIEKSIGFLRDVLSRVEANETKLDDAMRTRFGDILAGSQKIATLNTEDLYGVYRYIYGNVLTDGYWSSFDTGEAAKRFSPATRAHIFTRETIDREVANLSSKLHKVTIRRVSPHGAGGVEPHDGEMWIAGPIAAALERYYNINGTTIKTLGSLMKVQVVETSELDPGEAIRFYTGDLKSQGPAMVSLIARYMKAARAFQDANPDRSVDFRTVYLNSKDSQGMLRQILYGIVQQSEPVDKFGEGAQSVQFNNMGTTASLSSATFNPKGIYNNIMKNLQSGLEFRNAQKSALRNSMKTDQGSYQIYNSQSLTEANSLVDKFIFDNLVLHGHQFTVPHAKYGQAGFVYNARADYQAEIPLLTLAKQVLGTAKGKPRQSMNQDDTKIVDLATEIIRDRSNNKSIYLDQGEANSSGSRLMSWLAKKDNSFYVKQSVSDSDGKSHSVFLTSITRFSVDGGGHTLPFLVSRIGTIDKPEKLGLNVRGASAQSGDFDKDTVIQSTMSNDTLKRTMENRYDYRSGTLDDNFVLIHLFGLHDMTQKFERANPARSFHGPDKMGVSNPNTQILFGRLISEYTVLQNSLALMRRDGADGKFKIEYNTAYLTESGHPRQIGEDVTNEETIIHRGQPVVNQESFNFMVNDHNLSLFIKGQGKSEYDQIVGGKALGSIRTDPDIGGTLSRKGYTYRSVKFSNALSSIMVMKEGTLGRDLVGIYAESPQNIDTLMRTATNDDINSVRSALAPLDEIVISSGDVKVIWAPEVFRAGSATFVDYVKSHGGEKGMFVAYGTSNIADLVTKSDNLNRLLVASQATQIVKADLYGKSKIFAVPLEYAAKYTDNEFGPDLTNKILTSGFDVIKAEMLKLINPVTRKIEFSIGGGDELIRKIAWDILKYETVIKGGLGLVNPVRNTADDPNARSLRDEEGKLITDGDGKEINNYTRFEEWVKTSDENSLSVLPAALKGVAEIMQKAEWSELRDTMLLPKEISSRLYEEQFRSMITTRGGFFPTGESSDLLDKAFTAYRIIESLRDNFPMYVTRGDLAGIHKSSTSNELLLDGINSIDDLARRIQVAVSKSTTVSGSAFTFSTIKNFLVNDLKLTVTKGKPYAVRTTEDLRTSTQTGMVNSWVNSARKEGRRMTKSIESGVWGNLTTKGGSGTPLTADGLYKLLVSVSSGKEDRSIQVLARAIYTGIATAAVSTSSRTDMIALGFSNGAHNLKVLSEAIGTKAGEMGMKYKLDLEVLKKIQPPGAQEGQRLLDEVIIEKNMYKYSNEPVYKRLKEVCNV